MSLHSSGLEIANVKTTISNGPTVGLSVTIAVTLVTSVVVVVTLVIIAILRKRQLQKSR